MIIIIFLSNFSNVLTLSTSGQLFCIYEANITYLKQKKGVRSLI